MSIKKGWSDKLFKLLNIDRGIVRQFRGVSSFACWYAPEQGKALPWLQGNKKITRVILEVSIIITRVIPAASGNNSS